MSCVNPSALFCWVLDLVRLLSPLDDGVDPLFLLPLPPGSDKGDDPPLLFLSHAMSPLGFLLALDSEPAPRGTGLDMCGGAPIATGTLGSGTAACWRGGGCSLGDSSGTSSIPLKEPLTGKFPFATPTLTPPAGPPRTL